MALDRIGLKLIAPFIKGARVLCLGYPDISIPVTEVEKILGIKVSTVTNNGASHKKNFPVPETTEALTFAGAISVRHVDVARTRGQEDIVDLNEPQPWDKDYDLIINPGTIEHCFDICTATFNAWKALSIGGLILQVAPVSMVNHGFWNINPTAIADFANANGGSVLSMQVFDVKAGTFVDFEWGRRCKVPPECVMYALVRRKHDLPLKKPTQWRYQ